MTDTKSIFYLFALTPRAGRHNHVYIQPTAVPFFRQMPDVEGKDRVHVTSMVKQLTLGREGDEYLVLVAPNRELSTEAKTKIVAILTNYQERLAELVTQKIDWDKEGNMFMQHPDLDQWMNELRPQVADILGNSPIIFEHQKGNWIMRHKGLCAVIVLIVFLTITALKGQSLEPLKKLVDIGEIKINFRDFFGGGTQPEITDVRDDWIRALGIQGQFQAQQQKEQAIVQKLNSFFEGKKPNSLHDCLLVLNVCFGNPIVGTKLELQQFLDNEKLRGDITAVNSNRLSKLTKYRNDEVEQTLFRYFSEGKPEERAERFATLRQLLTVAIEIGKKVEAEKELPNDPMPNDPWVNFARLLYSGSEGYFMEAGKALSAGYKASIAEYKPQFVTPADIELSRVVYHWLTGQNAKSLIGNGSGNLQSALVAVTESSNRESPFTASEKFRYNAGTMNDQEKALYYEFLNFRKCAEMMVRQLEITYQNEPGM